MRRAILLAATSTLLATAACDGADDVSGASTTAGTYVLRSVNGAPLPYLVAGNGTSTTEIVEEQLVLYIGFTYAFTLRERVTTNGQATTVVRTDAGVWGVSGTSVIFTSSVGQPSRIARVDGDRMTIVEPGATWVYER